MQRHYLIFVRETSASSLGGRHLLKHNLSLVISEHVRTSVQALTLAEAAAFLPASRSGSLPRAAALRSSATSALANSFARCPDSARIAPLASSAFCSAS